MDSNELKGRTDEEIIRDQFKSTFSTNSGQQTLIRILDWCGYFATDPAFIIPENVAIANKIMLSLGSIDPDNIRELICKLVTIGEKR